MLSILYAHFISFCVYPFRLLVSQSVFCTIYSLLYSSSRRVICFICKQYDYFVWRWAHVCVCVFVSICAFETIIQYIVTVKYWIVTILAQFDHYSCPILFATVNCFYFKTELIYYLIWVLFNFFPFIHWISFFFLFHCLLTNENVPETPIKKEAWLVCTPKIFASSNYKANYVKLSY